jgi:NADH-quinone oxidoreductase subunit C
MADPLKPANPEGDPAKPAAEAPKAAPPKPAPPKAPAVMAAVPWESDFVASLKQHFGATIRESSTYLGQNFLVVAPDAVVPIVEYLKFEADFDYLVDITAVDWPQRAERFDIVYILYSFRRNERIRLKTPIPEGYRPATATGIHPTANWLEREIFDMFGIEFKGHPDLRRILMPDDWNGHPLRKDYPLRQQDLNWVHQNLGIESGQ